MLATVTAVYKFSRVDGPFLWSVFYGIDRLFFAVETILPFAIRCNQRPLSIHGRRRLAISSARLQTGILAPVDPTRPADCREAMDKISAS